MSSDGDASRDEPAAPGGARGTLNSEVGTQVMLSMINVSMMMITVTSGSKRLWTPPSLRRRAGTSVCAAGSQVWHHHQHHQHHHQHWQLNLIIGVVILISNTITTISNTLEGQICLSW